MLRLLSIHQLCKAYGGPQGRPVLRDVDLTLAAGDYVAIMGESGTGKSTLLNLIAGLDTPDAGRILLAGRELTGMGEAERTRLRRRSMGFVFQAFHLLPHLTVAQNVALPLALNQVPASRRRARVQALLAAVGLAARADSYPRELSGGQMQRVAVARALVHEPQLLLADEPTGNLDQDSAAQVLELLRRQVREHGCTAILVTHSRSAAASADRVYRLDAEGLHLQAPARTP
ncbi:ABC transporter ATP-binding protein [Thermithiobacillus tepidarius DSM 3134]|uniref:ABC transporter ATP-binding protein n=1 Tax=Thermithiobacillus tepidarius TaxID=929 RepID=UPI001E5E3C0C|nr:ABC transporter ATP-binding protein [Thermithiobacillus tepidarius]